MQPCYFLYSLLLYALCIQSGVAQVKPSPQRGYQLLLEKAYLPPAFDTETFNKTWQNWKEPLRGQAALATEDERRLMAYRRYGLLERRGDPRHRPLQYVVDANGNWTMNCLACHQGTVAGHRIPGAPNVQFALETLTKDIRTTKLQLKKPLTDLDLGSLVMPLGTTVGTTNAIMFGVALMHYRDKDLNIISPESIPQLTHHDHDAPPWWNVSRKKRLYSDNFAPRGHRALMQFLASRENGPAKFREWEEDFRHIESYIDSIQPPKYPFAIDQRIAAQGRVVFEDNCAGCHGTYGPEGEYPERIIPWDEVGTDPVRIRALSKEHRLDYERNWINEYGQAGEVIIDPAGYLAPPLNGIWASAPYFHNGSTPTLWHLLHPSQRPVIWVRTDFDGYDRQRVGLAVQEFEEMPPDLSDESRHRHYFDTRAFGKSAAGHTFPDQITDTEKHAVLEYLKTL